MFINPFWSFDSFGRATNKADNLNSNLFVYKYDGNDRLTNRWTPAKGNTAYRRQRGQPLGPLVHRKKRCRPIFFFFF
jgi:hypothetical protein